MNENDLAGYGFEQSSFGSRAKDRGKVRGTGQDQGQGKGVWVWVWVRVRERAKVRVRVRVGGRVRYWYG